MSANPTTSPAQVVEDNTNMTPTVFYEVSGDSDFPPVNPLGVYQDSMGNTHTWFYYIEPETELGRQFIQIYYNLIYANGSNFLKKLGREGIESTRFSIVQQIEFVETNDGKVFSLYFSSSLFGVSLRQIVWDKNKGFQNQKLSIPSKNDIRFDGNIIGPKIRDNQETEYYITGTNTTSSTAVAYKLAFNQSNFESVTKITIPTLSDNSSVYPINGIFDLAYINNTRYFLGSAFLNVNQSALAVITNYQNGTFKLRNLNKEINVAPVAPFPFISTLREDILRPQLVATNSGELFSFIFSFSESNNHLNQLGKWTSDGLINVFDDRIEDPFVTSFFPRIAAKNDTVQIVALGIQIAQGSFSLTLDRFFYESKNENLRKQKFTDKSLSGQIVLFAIDMRSDDLIGITGTLQTPQFVRDKYHVVNKTAGAVYLFSNNELPTIQPKFITNIKQAVPEDTDQQQDYSNIITIIVITLILLLVILLTIYRRYTLQLPSNIEEKAKEIRGQEEKSFGQKMSRSIENFLYLQFTNIRSKWKRILVWTFVLSISALIIFSVFTGILSHQTYLLNSYEDQNPINTGTNINATGDFVWTNTIHNDELTNNTIKQTYWETPRLLSSAALTRYEIKNTVKEMSLTTIFPLFEKRSGLTMEDGNNEIFHYPFPHNISVVDSNWLEYFQENLIAGRLPISENELILQRDWFVREDNLNNSYDSGRIWGVGTTLDLRASELDIYLNSSFPNLAQEFKIVGVIDPVGNQPFAKIKNWANRLNTTVGALKLLDKVPLYTSYLQATEFLNDFSRLTLRTNTMVNLRYDVLHLDRDEIPAVISGYEDLADETLEQLGFSWQGIFKDTRVISFLRDYFDASREVQLQASILLIPALGLTLLLTYQALGTGKTAVKEEIERYRKEGMRTETIISLFAVERLISTALASIIAFFLNPYITEQILQFTGFFEIESTDVAPVTSEFQFEVFMAVFLLTFVVGMILSIRYLITTSDWKYEKYTSNWRGDLLIVLLAGLLAWGSSALSNLFTDQLKVDPGTSELNQTSELLILSLRLLSLIILALAGVLIFSKIINRLYIGISSLVWKVRKSRITLIFPGIRSSINTYSKGLLVLIIAMFLIVPMISISPTLEGHYTTQGYEQLQTDIIVREWDQLSQEVKNIIRDHDDIVSVSPYHFGSLEFGQGQQLQILAIQPSTFMSSIKVPDAVADQFFLNQSLIRSVEKGQILSNTEFVDRTPFTQDESITVEFDHSEETRTWNLETVYNRFPIMDYEIENNVVSQQEPLQAVMSLAELKAIQNIYLNDSTQQSRYHGISLSKRDAIIRLESTDAAANIEDFLRENGISQFVSIDQVIEQHRHPFFRVFEYITHVSMIISFTAPLLFAIIASSIVFERRKFELEVYQRNGVTKRFFVLQLSIEYFLSTILPSILGVFAGTWWTVNYGIELFGETTQTIIWHLDPVKLWGFVFTVLIGSLFLWSLRLRSLIKRHIQEVRF